MDSIKHVSFDCWNTVLFPNPQMHSTRSQWVAHKTGTAPETISQNFKYYGKLFDSMEGRTGKSILPEERIYAVIYGISDLQISNDFLKQVVDGCNDIALNFLPMLINVNFPSIISRLKSAGITVSITCNTGNIPGHILRRIFKKLNCNFDYYIFSDEVGFAKPSFKIFDEVYNVGVDLWIEEHDLVRRGEILHVGDSQDADIDGALNAGFKSLLFTPATPNYEAIFSFIR